MFYLHLATLAFVWKKKTDRKRDVLRLLQKLSLANFPLFRTIRQSIKRKTR